VLQANKKNAGTDVGLPIEYYTNTKSCRASVKHRRLFILALTGSTALTIILILLWAVSHAGVFQLVQWGSSADRITLRLQNDRLFIIRFKSSNNPRYAADNVWFTEMSSQHYDVFYDKRSDVIIRQRFNNTDGLLKFWKVEEMRGILLKPFALGSVAVLFATFICYGMCKYITYLFDCHPAQLWQGSDNNMTAASNVKEVTSGSLISRVKSSISEVVWMITKP
jgi:preprotein translocase subunit Sec61beta